MINIDTRLLSKLDENDFWLLMHLVKFLGKKGSVWPSNKTICKDTKWHIEKVQRVKRSLIDRGFLSSELVLGSSNVYRFHTDLIGIFNGIDGAELLDPVGKTDIPPVGSSEGEATGKTDSKVLSIEVLSNEEIQGLPFSSLQFQSAWQEWKIFRHELKKKLTKTTIRQHFKLLSSYTEAEAIAMIEQSISNSWAGLFEVRSSGRTQGKMENGFVQ